MLTHLVWARSAFEADRIECIESEDLYGTFDAQVVHGVRHFEGHEVLHGKAV